MGWGGERVRERAAAPTPWRRCTAAHIAPVSPLASSVCCRFSFPHSYINELRVLTPHFAGYFGYGGRVLHIATHPPPDTPVIFKERERVAQKESEFATSFLSDAYLHHFSPCHAKVLLYVTPAHLLQIELIDWFLSFIFPCLSLLFLRLPPHASVSPLCLCSAFDSFSLSIQPNGFPPPSLLFNLCILIEYYIPIVFNNGDWFPG